MLREPVVVDDRYTGEFWRTIGEHKATYAQCYAQKQNQPAAGGIMLRLLAIISRICCCSPWLVTPAR